MTHSAASTRIVIRGEHRVTLGADKGYDTRDFVAECRNLKVTPHGVQWVRVERFSART